MVRDYYYLIRIPEFFSSVFKLFDFLFIIFCVFSPSINNTYFPEQSSSCKLSPSSFQIQQYQSDQYFSTISPLKQQLFSSTHVTCQTTSILNNKQIGSNSTQTSSLTYRLINAYSSIYKPFSLNTNKPKNKCLPFFTRTFSRYD